MEEHQEPVDRTLDADERRVLGVLVEKAKTTPDAYPLSLNALRTGCNQKSNRSPQVDFDDERVERAADSLRSKKALVIVQGDSRVERYRHLAYDWLGVEKQELAVMAELLLRGAQTVGELRGRAARMEPIAGMAELNPLLRSLGDKGLVVYLTPPGRGAVVSHTFYTEKELERVRRDLGLDPGAAVHSPGGVSDSTPPPAPTNQPQRVSHDGDTLEGLRSELMREIESLREEVADLRRRLDTPTG